MFYFKDFIRCKTNRILWISLSFIFISLTISGCTSHKFRFDLVDESPEISQDTLKIETYKDYFLEGRELIVPGYLRQAYYEPQLNKMLFTYTSNKEEINDKTFILYDMERDEIQWFKKGNPYIDIFNEDVIIFQKGTDSKIYDIEDGSYLRDAEKGLYLIGNAEAIILTSEKYARINIQTGEEFWQKKGFEWEGYRNQYQDEDWLYVVAEGIHAFQIENGEGWDYETSTFSKDHMKEMAKQCGLTLLAALGGGYNTSAYQPEVTHNLCSNLLFINDNVYFVARRNIYCFNKISGEIIWSQEIPEELGSMWLHQISEEEIALTGEGWKYIDYRMNKALPPSFMVFNRESGDLLNQFKTEDYDFLLDNDLTQPDKYFLTSKKLYKFDADFNLTGTLEKSLEYGNFIRLVETEEILVIRTESGVLSIDKNSLEELWFLDLGGIQMEKKEELKDNWNYPYLVWEFENIRNWTDGELYWFASIDGITAVDIFNDGQIITEIPVSGSDFRIDDDGDLISTFEESLTFISLKQTHIPSNEEM